MRFRPRAHDHRARHLRADLPQRDDTFAQPEERVAATLEPSADELLDYPVDDDVETLQGAREHMRAERGLILVDADSPDASVPCGGERAEPAATGDVEHDVYLALRGIRLAATPWRRHPRSSQLVAEPFERPHPGLPRPRTCPAAADEEARLAWDEAGNRPTTWSMAVAPGPQPLDETCEVPDDEPDSPSRTESVATFGGNRPRPAALTSAARISERANCVLGLERAAVHDTPRL